MTPQEREERRTATEAGTEEKEQDGGRSPATQASNGAGSNGSPLRTAAKAGALAAAAGTTVYVTRRILRSEPGAQEGSENAARAQSRQAGSETRTAGNGGSRFDAFVSTLNNQGLDAAANMLVPVAESAAHAAGAYAAEKSPDFLADTILPKFVDGFNEARKKLTRGSGSEQEAERPESS
jgi:hypothetical protein